MSDVVLESVRAAVLFGLVLYLITIGRTKLLAAHRGWSWIVAGLGLLLLEGLVDIAGNFETLNRFFVFGDTDIRPILGIFFGFPGGVIVLVIGLVRWTTEDLDKRNQTETSLQKSEDRFRAFAESASDWFWETDSEHRFTLISGSVSSFTGKVRPSDFYGKTRWDMADSVIASPGTWDAHRAQLDARQPFKDLEYAVMDLEGNLYHRSISGMPVYDKNGIFKGYRGVGKDITARINAEDELRKNKDLFQALADNLPETIFLKDVEGRYLFVNKRFEDLCALDRDDIIGKTVHDIYFANRHQAVELASEDHEVIQTKTAKTRETVHLFPSGTVQTIISTRFPVMSQSGELIGLGLVGVDISKLKEAEQQIKESERTVRDVIENLPQAVVMWDPDKNLLAWNQRYAKLIGVDDRNLKIGTSFRQLADDLARSGFYGEGDPQEIIEDRIKVLWGRDVKRSEASFHNGRTYHQTTQKTSNGNLVVTYTDITVLKLAEQKVRESEQVVRGVLETVPQCIAMFDVETRLVAWNQNYEKLFRYEKGELVQGKLYRELVETVAPRGFYGEGDFSAFVDARVARVWKNSERRMDIAFDDDKTYDETIQRTKDGGLLLVYTDISERKEAEAKIEEQRDALEKLNQQKTRLFSIVAHDLRSPFTALTGYTEILSNEAGSLPTADIAQFSKTINDAAWQTLNLMNNLLEWALAQLDQTTCEPVPINVHDLVEQSLIRLELVAKAKGVSTENRADAISVMADSNMTDTVIRNLITNSIKFTPENGKIVIATKRDDDWTEISVTDTGIGMGENQLNDLFDLETNQSTPGTKGEAGSGLGLVLCKEFVEKQGGVIFVESTIGKGTSFRFTLPSVTIEDRKSLEQEKNM